MIKKQKIARKPSEICLVCDCTSEILRIEYDAETELTYLAIYSCGYKMSLWQKFRYIYQVIVYGKPFGDQIVLNKIQIKDLLKFLK